MTTVIKKNNVPNGWITIKLGDFVENEKGKKPKSLRTDKSAKFSIPYVDIKAFEQGIVGQYTDGENCRLCYDNDLLMVWDGSRSGLVGKGVNGALGSTLVRLNFHGICNDYAFYFLKSKYLPINSRAKGTGTPHVDPDLLLNYEFPLPPLPEQQWIVDKIEELFSDLDNGIENLKLLQEKLKVYRQAVLKYVFEGKLTANWRKKNADKLEPAEKLLKKIKVQRQQHYEDQLKRWEKDVAIWEEKGRKEKRPIKPKKSLKLPPLTNDELAKLFELPKVWKWSRLAEIADIKGGITKDQKKNYYNGRSVPYLRVANVQRGYLDLSEIKKIEASEELIYRLLLQDGDVLFTEGGDRDKLGRGCVWNGEISECIYQNHIFRARFYLDSMYSQIISWFGNSFGQIYFMKEGKQTTNLASINLTKLRNFPIPIIPCPASRVFSFNVSYNSLSSMIHHGH